MTEWQRSDSNPGGQCNRSLRLEPRRYLGDGKWLGVCAEGREHVPADDEPSAVSPSCLAQWIAHLSLIAATGRTFYIKARAASISLALRAAANCS